ncbi:MAG: hypothetical protein DWQ08_03450, partial [Proteobacteria bacterium]
MADRSSDSPTGNDATNRLRESLASRGLGLLAVILVERLPASLRAAITENAVRAGLGGESNAWRVLVAGNIGGAFWNRITPAVRTADDPVDTYSASCLTEVFGDLHANSGLALIYPGICTFSLQQLGELCGWGVPSWLGISIHPEMGTWFAFRAVAVTDAPLAATTPAAAGDACLACRSRDCLEACPVDAPGRPGQFDLKACLSHRLSPASACATTCLARVACPVGASRRYTCEAIDYFYTKSLDS